MYYIGVLPLLFFYLSLISALAAKTLDEIIKSNGIVQVTVSEPSGPESLRVVNIYCKMHTNGKPKLDFIYNKYRINQVNFHNCPPTDCISDILKALDINLNTLEDIVLKDLPIAPVLEDRHFERLNLVKKLSVYGVGPGVRPNSDFVKNLNGLEELKVTNVELGGLPAGNKIEIVHLAHGVSLGAFGGCNELLSLTVENWTLPADQAWLANCSNLDVIKAIAMHSPSFEKALSNIPSVLEVDIKNCNLSVLTKDLLSSAAKMSALQIVDSGLGRIERDAFESHAATLEELDLCYNELTDDVAEALKPLTALRRLALCNNHVENFCHGFPSIRNSSLTSLFLRECGLTHLCFDELLSLNTLDLEGNNITVLDFDKLPLETTRVFPLDVKLKQNPITNTSFSDTLYHSLDHFKKRNQVDPFAIISVDRTHCQSGSYWLLQALKKNFVSVDGLTCEQVNIENKNTIDPKTPDRKDGTPGLPEPGLPGQETNKSAGKARYQCDQCQCEGSGNYIKAYCKNVHRIPRIKGMRELYAEGNNIQGIEVEDITYDLKFMDLRYNSISRMEGPVLREIFKWPRRKILLAGNPIACDCNNVEMLTELSNYPKQVDYKNIFCTEARKWLKRIDLDSLCKVDSDGAVGITLSTLALASSVLVVVIKLY